MIVYKIKKEQNGVTYFWGRWSLAIAGASMGEPSSFDFRAEAGVEAVPQRG
jgi:hypothetical protein